MVTVAKEAKQGAPQSDLDLLKANYVQLNQQLKGRFPHALQETEYGLLLKRQSPMPKDINPSYNNWDILFTEYGAIAITKNPNFNKNLPEDVAKKLEPNPVNQPYTDILALDELIEIAEKEASFFVENGFIKNQYLNRLNVPVKINTPTVFSLSYEYLPMHEARFQENLGKMLALTEKRVVRSKESHESKLGQTSPEVVMAGILKGAETTPNATPLK